MGLQGVVIAPAVVVYGLLLLALGMLRTEHVFILGAWVVLTYVPRTRPWVSGLLPFFLFALVYDALRFVIPEMHRLVPINVAGPYHLEIALFGIRVGGQLVPPSSFLQHIYSPVLLLSSGFAYFFFIYEVILLGIFMLVRERTLLPRFAWAFFFLSLLGFVTWCIYPAAPPWYVAKYGLGPANLQAVSDPARLAAVDKLLGFSFFTDIYSRSSNVFGAVPSLHAAYPLLVYLFVRRSCLARVHWLFLAFWLLMCFAAVYLQHHYVIDVLLGSFYAVITFLLVERWWPRREAQPALSGEVHG